MTLTWIALAANSMLLASGMPEIERAAFGPLSPCELAMLQTPGLTAVELRPGEGEPLRPGDRATIAFRIFNAGGFPTADTGRRGLAYEFVVDSDGILSRVSFGMVQGEKRRATLESRAAFGSHVGMTFEIELLAIARGPVAVYPLARR